MSKYEFTGETKIVLGVKLQRIRALVAIDATDVVAGDLGGWIGSEKNLSRVSGNAWVSGDASVYGNARVYGDASVSPICISGLGYHVTIADAQIVIGCEKHEISEWRGFDDRRIAAMDGATSAKFWRDHKAMILGLCDLTGRPLAQLCS